MKKYLVKKHFDEIKSQDEIGNVTVERIFIGYEVLYSTDSKSSFNEFLPNRRMAVWQGRFRAD